MHLALASPAEAILERITADCFKNDVNTRRMYGSYFISYIFFPIRLEITSNKSENNCVYLYV